MEQNMKKSAVKEKLSMIDEPLRINLVKNCILAGLLFVIGGLTAVYARSFWIFCGFAILATIYASLHIYQGLKYLDGDVLKYTGACIKKSPIMEGKKKSRKYVIIKLDEETLLKVYNDKARSVCEVGDVVCAYIPSSALFQVNSNTYATNAVYYCFVQETNANAVDKKAD